GDVVHRHHGRDLAAHGHGLGGGGEEVVERAALVGLEVREGDVAQLPERQHPADRLGHERKEPPGAGVEEERLVVGDEVLVEVEVRPAGNLHGGVDAVDARGDLVEVGACGGVGDHRALLSGGGWMPGMCNELRRRYTPSRKADMLTTCPDKLPWPRWPTASSHGGSPRRARAWIRRPNRSFAGGLRPACASTGCATCAMRRPPPTSCSRCSS